MFSQVFVCPRGGGSLSRGGLCPGGSLSRGGHCPGGSLSGLCRGGLCAGGVTVQGGLCQVSVWGGGLYPLVYLCPVGGGLCLILEFILVERCFCEINKSRRARHRNISMEPFPTFSDCRKTTNMFINMVFTCHHPRILINKM